MDDSEIGKKILELKEDIKILTEFLSDLKRGRATEPGNPKSVRSSIRVAKSQLKMYEGLLKRRKKNK